ncbi:uncharacterized protein [Nicotiana tomentosiformis]|uniref:uncharacterized protein isoform X2 n=1 Tax=Nicotiana tomentosiformis TaxID=4098 RepID=UPI00388C47E8
MPSSFSQPARNFSMPSSKFTPFSGIPSSSCPVMPSSSSPAIPSSSSFGIRSSFSPIIHSSSSSGMSSSFSQPASHSFMPSFEFTPSSSPSISRPDNGVDGNSTSPYTDSDTATQPPTQTSIRRQDPPNIGKYDDLRRLIIVPDGAGFYPSQATKVVVESMCSFYQAPWRFWSDVPSHIRDRMFAEFRMKCALSRDFKAEVRVVFFKKYSDRLSDMLQTTRESKKRPSWILDDIWVKLLEYWNSPKFEKKSEQGRVARLSNKGGSVHTGGSISMAAHRRRLAKGRPVTHDEVFEETHIKKLKDGIKTTWIEPRAETTHDNFKRILEEFI